MLAVVITALMSAANPHPDCEWKSDYVSASASVVVDAEMAQALDPASSIAEIVHQIGPAKRDVGSGIHVLLWQLSDGRHLRVGAPDACTRPMHRAVIPAGGA
jgi:hypothetical protein